MPLNAIKIRNKIKTNFFEVLTKQQQDRGLEPLKLEPQLLLKRIKDGDYSGQFLADAFLSMYRIKPFPHSLGGLNKLDAEAFRLFHEILHARFINGWNDNDLFQIEQEIKIILDRQNAMTMHS